MKRRIPGSADADLRTDRMFREQDGWYFRTREGATAGPFREELEASTQLEIYIRMAATGLLPESDADVEPEDLPAPRVAVKRVG